MKAVITGILIFSFGWILGQDMNPGFTLLETGKYKAATSFFSKVIDEFPENRTARLCYARAIGLNGNPIAAMTLFGELLQEYPNDFELELNYAESLLWNKSYVEAKSYYETLLKKQANNFSTTLGYANALSNLQEYDAALVYINKAISLDSRNPNALISRKYIRLGKAAKLNELGSYNKAKALLNENMVDYPNDLDTQLAMINGQLLQSDLNGAEQGYRSISDSVISLTGLSLIAHLKKKDQLALNLASDAKEFTQKSSDSVKILSASERFVQALLWNHKYSQAKKEIEALEQLFSNHLTVKSLRASLGMYKNQISKSLANYKSILVKDPTSFDGNLGIANAYRANGDNKLAYKYAQRTLELYPHQKDALSLIKTIVNDLSPVSTGTISYSIDNGNNEAISLGAVVEIPVSPNSITSVGYNYRTTENKDRNEMAYNTNLFVGLKYRLINNTWLEGNLGFVKANTESNDYTDVNGSIFLSSRPLPKQYLKLGYGRELQSFNAALIEEKIFMNNFSINYNLGTNFGLGWYTNYMLTTQTDDNLRNLLFTSLYYNFTDRPLLKGGINYQILGFKNQVPELYFSPSNYQAIELFMDLTGATGPWSYALNAATGLQYVEQQDANSLFRVEGRGSYRVSDRLQLGAYGKYSNIASETASGFEFTEVGISLRWQLSKKPIFKLD